ncbi:hypothetical protein [Rickettsiales endosymbiont of Stachyamoeba lipophora]|uniref:hypothetical protein n=1 Tax=Rickettsiales endosymbiont of Stachyamoeba lipophora TaxID=2486578 RepID=UPI000F64DD52|nr:hypothetical protein [Rickettsiales endosymbiont of Stachyamoeba lipophora]AZL15339.1 hypothetical protein EF513_02055 [Rickettsiales endosymbiont of Stachyamoeba lipophora]
MVNVFNQFAQFETDAINLSVSKYTNIENVKANSQLVTDYLLDLYYNKLDGAKGGYPDIRDINVVKEFFGGARSTDAQKMSIEVATADYLSKYLKVMDNYADTGEVAYVVSKHNDETGVGHRKLVIEFLPKDVVLEKATIDAAALPHIMRGQDCLLVPNIATPVSFAQINRFNGGLVKYFIDDMGYQDENIALIGTSFGAGEAVGALDYLNKNSSWDKVGYLELIQGYSKVSDVLYSKTFPGFAIKTETGNLAADRMHYGKAEEMLDVLNNAFKLLNVNNATGLLNLQGLTALKASAHTATSPVDSSIGAILNFATFKSMLPTARNFDEVMDLFKLHDSGVDITPRANILVLQQYMNAHIAAPKAFFDQLAPLMVKAAQIAEGANLQVILQDLPRVIIADKLESLGFEFDVDAKLESGMPADAIQIINVLNDPILNGASLLKHIDTEKIENIYSKPFIGDAQLASVAPNEHAYMYSQSANTAGYIDWLKTADRTLLQKIFGVDNVLNDEAFNITEGRHFEDGTKKYAAAAIVKDSDSTLPSLVHETGKIDIDQPIVLDNHNPAVDYVNP